MEKKQQSQMIRRYLHSLPAGGNSPARLLGTASGPAVSASPGDVVGTPLLSKQSGILAVALCAVENTTLRFLARRMAAGGATRT